MPSKRKIILVGFFLEVFELIQRTDYTVEYIVDPRSNIKKIIGVEHYRDDADFISSGLKGMVFISPDLPLVRAKLYDKYKLNGFQFSSLVCNSSIISHSASLGAMHCIQSFVNISSNVRIGIGVKINSCANIMHDCKIGNFVTIAPSATILGHVSVGNHAYIGSNSTVLPGITVGDGAVVGAGSVVTKDVLPNTVVCKNPAVPLIKQ